MVPPPPVALAVSQTLLMRCREPRQTLAKRSSVRDERSDATLKMRLTSAPLRVTIHATSFLSSLSSSDALYRAGGVSSRLEKTEETRDREQEQRSLSELVVEVDKVQGAGCKRSPTSGCR